MKIFIGHDSKYPQATAVCIKSIKDNGFTGHIEILDKTELKTKGIYDRKDIKGESTEFSFKTLLTFPILIDLYSAPL